MKKTDDRTIRTLRDAGSDEERAAELAARFTQSAAADGLADIAYADLDSPFGPLVVAATGRGLVRVAFAHEGRDEVLADLAAEVSPRVLELPARLDDVRRELERYFEGRLRDFTLPLDWRLSHGFRRKVLRATARVPYGATSSYAEVAAEAGSPRAYRAAGSALATNPIPIIVPCHRILRSGGVIGNYGGGPKMKEKLLHLEGAL